MRPSSAPPRGMVPAGAVGHRRQRPDARVDARPPAVAHAGPAASAPPRARPQPPVALITGATSDGIGRQLLQMLLDAGWHAISIARPQRAADHAQRFAGQRVDVRACDCGDMAAIRGLAADLRADPRYPQISLMVHSLGVIRATRQETAGGLEENLAVNALAPWLWTRELLPCLSASGAARVVQISSSGLRRGRLDCQDLQSAGARYEDFDCYFTSKLVNLHLMSSLQRQTLAAGLPVAINAVHPGLVRTELGRHLGDEGGCEGLAKKTLGRAIHHRLSQSAQSAAAPIFSFATEPRFAHLRGSFVEPPSPLKRLGATLQRRQLSPWVAADVGLDAHLSAEISARCAQLVGPGGDGPGSETL